MLDRIAFVIGETLIALRRNLALGFAAITTTAISLYLLAGMMYVGDRASTYLAGIPGRFEMVINLKDGTNYDGIKRTAKYLRLEPGVASVVWVPRQKAWERVRRESPDLAEGLGDESPLPDSFRVRLNDLSKSDQVAATARKMSTVDPNGGVQYFSGAQSVVAQWLRFVRNLSYWIGGLLFAVAGILILNAIRLTVESRRVEIRIMRLVGASRMVVNLPFVLEGMVHGALGGALAAAGLHASQRAVETRLADFAMGVSLAPFPLMTYLGALCAVGGGYGGFCSLLALRTPMRARTGG